MSDRCGLDRKDDALIQAPQLHRLTYAYSLLKLLLITLFSLAFTKDNMANYVNLSLIFLSLISTLIKLIMLPHTHLWTDLLFGKTCC